MIPQVATVHRLTASALVYTGRCYLASLIVGVDGVNDPVVGVYNDTDGSTAGNRVIPSVTYDATILGISGVVLQFMKDCTTGLYVSVANIGSGEVIVDYRPIDR